MNHICFIAAHDTSAGAGIIRDCLVAHDFEVWPHPVVTALTCQSFSHVESIFPIPDSQIKRQFLSILEHFPIKVIKIGMLYQEKVVERIVEELRDRNIPSILDPVFVSSGGEDLTVEKAYQALIDKLMPLATVVTPNRSELETICAQPFKTMEEAVSAAQGLASRWNNFILLKGGHFDQSTVTDFLISSSEIVTFDHPRQKFHYSHGTGCVLSTALTCSLALGMNIKESFFMAVQYTISLYQKLNSMEITSI